MTEKQILIELRDFLTKRINDAEDRAMSTKLDPIANVHLVGQGFAYREVRCFLEHRIKSIEEDKK